ncbi:hypothetical protein CVIRNUC_008230 [Coccomyxa viridis]|uniref:COP9 signalosome complex subunit 3 n=1 Tax=Coccomyxa viridis TaxID=1274662 RepID=A0AAV1IFK5_9CHLO|nr:hypothetical protein CVIRNUC_008230 [Coccomyxa viridis]
MAEQLAETLKNLSADPAQLLQYWTTHNIDVQQPLDVFSAALRHLDATQQPLAYLLILDCRGGQQAPQQADEGFISHATSFLNGCTNDSSNQIRVAPEKLASLSHKLRDHLLLSQRPQRGIRPLRTAITSLIPSPTLITPLHADLFLLCIVAKCYSAAMPVLDQEFDDVDPKKTGMTARDFLLFCYYGGMIYTGLKEHAKALAMFLFALTAPTMVVNAITMAAFRKHALVSLIHTGAHQQLPKFAPSSVTRAAKSECAPYLELATAYSKSDEAVSKVITQHAQTFQEDGNAGLVKQALAARQMRQTQRLTQTYLTLSLADIARQIGLASPQQAEQHILRMVDAGEVYAQIDEAASTVRFLQDPERYDSASVVQRLESQMRRAMALGDRIRAVNNKISCDRAYLSKAGGRGKQAQFEDPGGDLALGRDLGGEMSYSFNA